MSESDLRKTFGEPVQNNVFIQQFPFAEPRRDDLDIVPRAASKKSSMGKLSGQIGCSRPESTEGFDTSEREGAFCDNARNAREVNIIIIIELNALIEDHKQQHTLYA